MRKLIIISVLLVIVTGLNGQIDSLKKALSNAKHDTVRCNVLTALIYAEPDENICQQYGEKIITIAENNSKDTKLNNFYLKQLAFAHEIKGVCLSNKGLIIQSLECLNHSLKIRRTLGLKKETAHSLLNISAIYIDQNEYSKALYCTNECIEIQKSVSDSSGLSGSFLIISVILNQQGKFNEALDYAKLALEISQKKGLVGNELNALNSIGTIFSKMGEKTKAILYYTESLDASKKIKYKQGIAQAYNNLSSAFLDNKNYKKAAEYGSLALTASLDSKNPGSIKTVAKTLKDIYQKQNKPAQALEMYELYIKMRDSISNEQTRKAVIQKQYQIEYEKKALSDSLRVNEEKNLVAIKNDLEISKRENQKMALYIGLALVLVFSTVLLNRFQIIKKQKAVIENNQKEILASIRYAKRIQTSLLPTEKYIDKSLNRLIKN